MNEWDFFRWLLGEAFAGLEARLLVITNNQTELKELIMAVKQTVEQHAAAVNEFSNQLALAIEGIRADILEMKTRLAEASTVAEVEAILQPATDKLKAQADALTALDAENVPTIPPVPPPEEPPL